MNNELPHTRLNPLTGEWVLVSPHRLKRPWQGKTEEVAPDNRPQYDEKCYLCPGNERVGGEINPSYEDTFVFINDFAALLPEGDGGSVNENDLFLAESIQGTCRVICFSPRHDLTLPRMEQSAIRKVVDAWEREFSDLAAREDIGYIQIFENKGAIMGCSNPHPHGQIWATNTLPLEPTKEDQCQKAYSDKHGGATLIGDYLKAEEEKKERLIVTNDHWVALVPYWAKWPYETLVAPRRAVGTLPELTDDEKDSLADILQKLTIRYDNLFQCSFPYTMGFHQAPVLEGDFKHWHMHLHFYPPLLRSATVQKFMVGYEMLGTPQRDITAEMAAGVLRDQSEVHYLVGRD